jgi:DNA-binding CsgD family transcriptional regulator
LQKYKNKNPARILVNCKRKGATPMKLTHKREWALIAAFILCQLSLISVYIFMNINMKMDCNPEKIRQMTLFNILGICSGVLFLPIIIPLKELKYGQPLSRYYLRLALIAILFLPNIILRLWGPEFWLGNSPLSTVISFCNGATMTFIYGLFVSLISKNRVFWFALSISLRQLVLFFMPFLDRYFPPSFISTLLFYTAAMLILIFGVLIFIFLFSISSDDERVSALPVSDSTTKRFHWPVYLLPLLAALLFFWTNSFTNKLFMPAQSLWDLDFYHSIALFISLPIIGFLSGISWLRYLKTSIYVCAVLFLLSPALLFSSSSQVLFLVIYTLNNIAMYVVVTAFPFIILDLYWKNTRNYGYWAYFLAIIIYIIRMNIWIAEGLFKNISIDNAYAVLLLSFAAIVFFVLSRIFLNAFQETILPVSLPAAPELKTSYMNRMESFREHNLTNRETQTAELILQGLSNNEIKEKMSISMATVKTYVSEILKKYNVKQRAEFMAKFFKP